MKRLLTIYHYVLRFVVIGITLSLLLFLSTNVTQVKAYRLIGCYWASEDIPVVVNLDNVVSLGEASREDVKQEILTAMNTWNNVNTSFYFVARQGSEPYDVDVTFIDWDCGLIDSDFPSPGQTSFCVPGTGCDKNNTEHWTKTPTGTIYKVWINIDSGCSFGTRGERYKYDLQSVVLHELGHALGLNETQFWHHEAVMFPYIRHGWLKRNLTQDDIDGLTALYPISPLPHPPSILDFRVLLKNVPSNNQSSEVEIVVLQRGTNNIVLGPLWVTTNSNGYYTGLELDGVGTGIYDICVKPKYHLGLCARDTVLFPGSSSYIDFSQGGVNPSWPGDVDVYGGDNVVNSLDSAAFIAEFRRCPPFSDCNINHRFDFNRDGVLNLNDYSLLLAAWQYNPQGEGNFGNPFAQQLQSTGRSISIALKTDDNQLDASLLPPWPVPVLAVEPLASSGLPVGQTFNAWIWLDTAGISTHGVDVLVHYDPGVLEVLDEDPNSPGIQVLMGNLYPNVIENTADPSMGLIKIAAAYGKDGAFNGSGKLAEMRFRVVAATDPYSTDVSVIFMPGDSADSNITEDGTGLDVLEDAGVSHYTFTGSPYRIMPTINIIPESGSYVNEYIVSVIVDVDDPYDQVQRLVFQAYYDNRWHDIGVDKESSDGWSIIWDTSSITDQVIKIRATAWLPGELRASAENDPIYLDRSPPVYASSTFTPPSPGCAGMVRIWVDAHDEVSLKEAQMWVNTATDGSDSGEWVFVDSQIYGYRIPECPPDDILWRTASLAPGTHRIAFLVIDEAGNSRVITEEASVPITYTIIRSLYDFDGDWDVDIVDIMRVSSRWGSSVADGCLFWDPTFDLDGDGDVDVADIMMVAAQWREYCAW